MIKKVSFYLLGYLFTLMILSSCDYDFINPEPVVIPKDSIKFSTQIIPMFNKSCNATCHAKGGIAPDLSPANAYNSLITGNLVNTQDPPKSILYVEVTTGGMNVYGLNATDQAYILKWIEEGAHNN